MCPLKQMELQVNEPDQMPSLSFNTTPPDLRHARYVRATTMDIKATEKS